jgi:hypothetical protein
MKAAEFVEKVCALLVQQGFVSAEEAEELRRGFAQESELSFEYFLLEEGVVEKEALLRVLSLLYNRPAVDVEGDFFQKHLLRMFPKEIMLNYSFIPYEHEADVLIVVAAEPDDEALAEVIGRYVSYDVTYQVGIEDDIHAMIEEYYDASITEPEGDYPAPPDEEEAQEGYHIIHDPYESDEE